MTKVRNFSFLFTNFLLCGFVMISSCKKEEEQAVKSSLTTITIDNIAITSATSGGDISHDGGAPVTARGIIWSNNEMPDLDNNLGITSDGSGTGNYTSELIDLAASTTYYVRAYATNEAGTSYGEQLVFETLPEPEIKDDYLIGDVGPAGGFIFYINENYETDGWKYMELAPSNTQWNQKPWGGVVGVFIGGTKTTLGSGPDNTKTITEALGDTEPGANRTDYAAKLCNDLVVEHNGSIFDDWFLPSPDEQWEIWWNLLSDQSTENDGKGNMLPSTSHIINPTQFWSSSEVEAGNGQYARAFGFNNGGWNNQPIKDQERPVRAIRRF